MWKFVYVEEVEIMDLLGFFMIYYCMQSFTFEYNKILYILPFDPFCKKNSSFLMQR